MRVELDAFDSGLGLSGQVERIGVGVIDGAGLLEDLHGACELRRVLGELCAKSVKVAGTQKGAAANAIIRQVAQQNVTISFQEATTSPLQQMVP